MLSKAERHAVGRLRRAGAEVLVAPGGAVNVEFHLPGRLLTSRHLEALATLGNPHKGHRRRANSSGRGWRFRSHLSFGQQLRDRRGSRPPAGIRAASFFVAREHPDHRGGHGTASRLVSPGDDRAGGIAGGGARPVGRRL